MAHYLVETMICPICGETLDLEEGPDKAHCAACDNTIPLRGYLCPQCGAYHNRPAQACQNCGLGMTYSCPKCGTSNWTGEDRCLKCGAPLDIVAFLTRHVDTAERLRQQMTEANRIKAQEETAASHRLERLMEIDRKRQEALQRRRQEQQAQERKILITTGIIAGLALFLLLVYMVISLLS